MSNDAPSVRAAEYTEAHAAPKDVADRALSGVGTRRESRLAAMPLDLDLELTELTATFDRREIDCALVGALASALRGAPR